MTKKNVMALFLCILFYSVLLANQTSSNGTMVIMSGQGGVSMNALQSEDLPKGPVFSHERGFYSDPFDATISWTTESTIIYTLDGSDPKDSDTAFRVLSPAVVTIDPWSNTGRGLTPGVVLRAFALSGSDTLTQTMTHTYLFVEAAKLQDYPGDPWPSQNINGQQIDLPMDPDVVEDPRYADLIDDALLSLPTLSVVTDNDHLFNSKTGIFVNAKQHGEEWERPASVELINPDATIEGFQINAGLRIRGGYSRVGTNPKHAFRLFFRKEYGEGKLEYPLFEDEGVSEFDKIDLRTSQNYSWSYAEGLGEHNTMLREVFSRDAQRDMGQPYTRTRYYHLYLNGLYWGLFETQERSEASYAEAYFGGNREDYDVIKVDIGEDLNLYEIEATDGTLDAWNALWALSTEGYATDEAYYRVLGCNPDGTRNFDYPKYVDVDNLIDYMLITYYTGDFDAPISNFKNNRQPNNFYGIYNRNGQEGFKFFRHDSEHTLMYRDGQGFDRTGPYSCGEEMRHFNPQWLHQQLLAHPEYRRRFADRVRLHFTNGGVLTPEKVQSSILKRKAFIETAIIAESARWGDSKSTIPFTKDDDWEPEVNALLYEFIPNRTAEVMELFVSHGWFAHVEPPVFSHLGGLVDADYELTMTTDSGEIYYTLDGQDPLVPENPDDGIQFSVVSGNATKKVLVPTEDMGDSWKDIDYDDSSWMTCREDMGGFGVIGYGSGWYNMYITLNLKGPMADSSNANTSCYVRIPFTLTQESLDKIEQLIVATFFDGGYAIYINGILVNQENAQEVLTWNSTSVERLDDAINRYAYLNDCIDQLHVGENLLCIHGFSSGTDARQFMLYAELVGLSSSGLAGEPLATASVYSDPIQINQTVHVKARTLLDGEWSPLTEKTYTTSSDFSDFKITEIHYHPGDGETLDGSEAEFLEFKNIGSRVLDLSGLDFVDGIVYTFPENTLINPGEFVVLASNLTGFASRYSLLPTDTYDGQLDNGGERLVLVSTLGDTILDMEYDDKDPWPEAPDENGFSLHAAEDNPTGDPNDPAYWKTSLSMSGSPGSDDYVTAVPENSNLPEKFNLYPNYPNPFNPVTSIRFDIPKQSHVHIVVHDVLGRAVETLVDSPLQAGSYLIHWRGTQFASGVYFVQCQAGEFKQTQRMLLVK